MKDAKLVLTRTWRVVERLCVYLGLLAGVIVIILMIAVCADVITRDVIGVSLLWAFELSMYLLVGMVFLGGAYTQLVGGHVAVDLLYLRFSPRTKAIADVITSLLAVVYCAVLVWKGWELTWRAYDLGLRSTQAMGWPLFPSMAVIPVGAFLVSIVLIGKMSRSLYVLRKV